MPTHDILSNRKPQTRQIEGRKTMPKENDRHLGKRENIWFPFDEHEAMLKAMEELKEPNKSNFIRSAVRNFINEYNEKKGR